MHFDEFSAEIAVPRCEIKPASLANMTVMRIYQRRGLAVALNPSMHAIAALLFDLNIGGIAFGSFSKV